MQTKVGIRITDNMIKMYDVRICYYVEIREYVCVGSVLFCLEKKKVKVVFLAFNEANVPL